MSRLVVLVLAGFSATFLPGGRQKQMCAAEGLSVEGVTISAKPRTLEFKLPVKEQGEVRDLLTRDGSGALRLSVIGVTPPATDEPVGVQVFVNLPNASNPDQEGPESPLALPVFSFGARRTKPVPESFQADILPVLKQLQHEGKWNPDQPIRLTIRAVGNAQVGDISVREVKLSIRRPSSGQ
jgi:hypothetical protein